MKACIRSYLYPATQLNFSSKLLLITIITLKLILTAMYQNCLYNTPFYDYKTEVSLIVQYNILHS